ncbi:MAG: hypothetical protein H7070_09415 [Saprospiraceae bacterium]|nr:hypothetical protein [Pyrinomonadaceae bacterium]
MDIGTEIREQLNDAWIPLIYSEKVRKQRTRSFEMDIPKRENTPEILHTLLGIELKIKKKRFACPDLATARYLRVFARIGCTHVAIPYDITKISTLADHCEEAWQKLLLVLKEKSRKKLPPAKKRIRSRLIGEIRSEIAKLGAGEIMPEFKQSTKQRNN